MKRDPAVSSVISEVLLIALVLMLVPMVTISLMNQLPQDRVPTVVIKIGHLSDDSVILYHKGGDYIKKDDLSVIIRITGKDGKTKKESAPYRRDQLEYSTDYSVFDLGDSATIRDSPFFSDISKGSEITITVIVKNAVIFSGIYNYEG